MGLLDLPIPGSDACYFGINKVAPSYFFQVSRGFHKIKFDDWKGGESCASLLDGLDENMPLKTPSAQYGQEKINYLLVPVRGGKNGVVKSLRRAASYAARAGEERIEIKLIERTPPESYGYQYD